MNTPKSSEKKKKNASKKWQTSAVTPTKTPIKQLTIIEQFRRQTDKQEALKLSSPSPAQRRVISEREANKEICVSDDLEPRSFRNRLALSKELAPKSVDEKRRSISRRKPEVIFTDDEDDLSKSSSSPSFCSRNVNESSNQSWDALVMNGSHFTTPSKGKRKTSVTNEPTPSTSTAKLNESPLLSSKINAKATPCSSKKEETRTAFIQKGETPSTGFKSGKKRTPSRSRSGSGKGSPFVHKKIITPSRIDKLKQTKLSFESSPITKTSIIASLKVENVPNSSLKSRKRLTEGEFSPNHKRTKTCSTPLAYLENSDDDVTIIDYDKGNSGIPSIKCEKLSPSPKSNTLDVNRNDVHCDKSSSGISSIKREKLSPSPNSNALDVNCNDVHCDKSSSGISSIKCEKLSPPPKSIALDVNCNDVHCDRSSSGILSIKCEKLSPSPNSNALGVNCNDVQTLHPQTDQNSPKQERRCRFINKIPNCFEELRNSFTPLSSNNRIKKSQPNIFLRLAELKNKPIIVRGTEIVLEDEYEMKDTSDENINQEESIESQQLAYYWSNFLEIVRSVLNIPMDHNLFNEDDLITIKQYYLMSENAQMLYSRLFVRKHEWMLESRIKYPEVSEDLQPFFQELITANYLQGDSSLKDLGTVLDLLQVKQIKDLCKDFNVKCETTKKKCIESILNNCSKHKPLFSAYGFQERRLENILKKAKEVLSRCYRVADKPRSIFRRCMMLYSLSDAHWDSNNNDNQPIQLTTLMHINMGKLKFPCCKIEREKSIFRNREDLLNYEKAFTLESQIWDFIDDKNWNEAMQLCDVAYSLYQEFKNDEHNINHVKSLPDFLRKYTSGSLLTRCLNYRVDVFEKSKFYDKANDQLSELLSQFLFCQNYRGHWYERLALNTLQHLKKPIEALKIIETGLKDSLVTENYLLTLSNRANRIRNIKNFDLKLFEGITLFEADKFPEVEINGQKLEITASGNKSCFIDERDFSVCSVEQFALKNYTAEGYSKGVHAEGSVIVSIFGLLFWDVIYAEGIPDAFRSPHQAFPLDLFSKAFVKNREDLLKSRFELFKSAPIEIILELVAHNFMENIGTTSVVNWDLLNLEDFSSLIQCIGMKCLIKICKRFIKNLRHYRSGLPDLTVWNPENKMWKMVEVKGPGDRLSDKQIIWLNFLVKIGAPVEVCYVKAINGRTIPKSAENPIGDC